MEKRPAVYYVPSFTLKGIDSAAIIDKYLSGGFSKIDLISLPKGKAPMAISGGELKLKPSSSTDSRYIVSGWTGGSQIVTVGSQRFIDCESGKDYSESSAERCFWCRLPIEKVIGVPIKVEQVETITIYYMIDAYCCFECTLAGIIADGSQRYCQKYNLFHDARQYLIRLFRETYPGKSLNPSQDFRFLKINGGTMDVDTYFSNGKTIYTKLPVVVCLPAKIDFAIQANC